jgi:hypothetical protein
MRAVLARGGGAHVSYALTGKIKRPKREHAVDVYRCTITAQQDGTVVLDGSLGRWHRVVNDATGDEIETRFEPRQTLWFRTAVGDTLHVAPRDPLDERVAAYRVVGILDDFKTLRLALVLGDAITGEVGALHSKVRLPKKRRAA